MPVGVCFIQCGSMIATSHISIHCSAPGEVSEDKNNQFTSEQWIEAGPWLLLFVVPIAALGFRKGYLYALMIFMVPLPEPVQAFEWSSLWKNSDQRAQELLQQEQYDEAAETFTNEDWKSV